MQLNRRLSTLLIFFFLVLFVSASSEAVNPDQKTPPTVYLLLQKIRDVHVRSTHKNLSYQRQNFVLLRMQFDDNFLVAHTDSFLFLDSDSVPNVPIFIDESVSGKNKMSPNYSATPVMKEVMYQLFGDYRPDIDFFKNKINLLNKKILSPLSDASAQIYQFVADSVVTENSKKIRLKFEPKNKKYLAFEGYMDIDAQAFTLENIQAKFKTNSGTDSLVINQKFGLGSDTTWQLKNESIAAVMRYNLYAKTEERNPKIFIYQSRKLIDGDEVNTESDRNFAQSDARRSILVNKSSYLNHSFGGELLQWGANGILTGYVPVWKFDIGKIQSIARLTDVEGLRLSLPLQTNEKLWKDASVGGHIGYGFRNKEVKYSYFFKYKLPFDDRTIISVSHTDDYRRVDYDYNDFLVRESPLSTGDIDAGGTLLSLESGGYLNLRKETEIHLSKDWNNDIESHLYFRNNDIYAADMLPFVSNGRGLQCMNQKTVTLAARFSFGERKYDKHLNRFYVSNNYPEIYAIVDAGRYDLGDKEGYYSKLSTMIHQQVNLGFGVWDYIFEGGCIFGKVPYPLLEIPYGRESNGYSRFQFGLLNYMEYAADKYMSMHNELTLNGLLVNHVPLLKYLSLKELISFKVFYGTLGDMHQQVLVLPASIHHLNAPYTEVGIGFSNILHLFTLQSVWRLTDNRPGVASWGLKGSVRIIF